MENSIQSSFDSGLCNMDGSVENHFNLPTTVVEVDETKSAEVVYGAEYERYKKEVEQIATETLTDKKRVITNPGWHGNKPGAHQIPLDMDNRKNQIGYGLKGETCCENVALFCGANCGCPSMKTLRIGAIRILARVVMAVLLWAFFWSVTFPPCASDEDDAKSTDGNESTTPSPDIQPVTEGPECIIPGLPGSSLFGILMVFLWGMVAEALIVLIPLPFNLPPLPPLLGSLLIGIVLRNVPGINVAVNIDELWSSRLRNMALGVILGRAGLEVDKKQMYKLRWVVPRLAFSPCIIEACSYGVVAHWTLDLPWQWSFMLGFVCGAVAPACVVPSMIKFQEEGYGVEHGVPSLLIAAASIDDIVAINVFNILLTITFGGASIGYDIGIAFAEIGLGIALGLVGGYFLQKVPDRRQHNIIRDRTFLLLALSFVFIFATDGPIELAGAGTLGTLICSFVAAVGWQHNQAEAVAHHFKAIWFYFQPLLFGLTGATVEFSQMEPWTVAMGIVTMLICLTIRMAVAGNAVSFLGWSHKEKLMTAISWIPKATVQAAIGGTALSTVRINCGDTLYGTPCNKSISFVQDNDQTMKPGVMLASDCVDANEYRECKTNEGYALIILQVSVLLILITAPIGVFLIGVAGPRLLEKSNSPPILGIAKDDEDEIHSDTGISSVTTDFENGGKHNHAYEEIHETVTRL